MTRSYAVIGTGAIGGYYGGRLAAAGCDVHFLLHSDYEHVTANGLVVDSVKGDFALPNVKAYRCAVDMPLVDVALVCLKTTQNAQLPELLPPIKPDGAVLPLQNGLGVEASIQQILQARKVAVPTILGGLCFICASKLGPGHIRHIDYGRLLIGACEHTEQVGLLEAIAQDFQHAGVPTEITDDLAMARWLKLVWNVPYNGLSVVLDATTQEMMADDSIRQLITTLMREVVLVANAWGQQHSENSARALPPNVVDQMLEQTETMPSYLTSMKLDFDHTRPMEIEAILGAPLKAAREIGVSVPTMHVLYQQLCFLERRNIEH